MNQEYTNVQQNERKRKRLSTACNRCRSRKTKCDDREIACTNCFKANVECVTRDPREPHVEVPRREAQSQPYSPVSIAASRDGAPSTPVFGDAAAKAATSEGGPRASTSRPSRQGTSNNLSEGILPLIPLFMSGNCQSLLTQWLDLAFARLGIPERFSDSLAGQKRNSISTFVYEDSLVPIRSTESQESFRDFLTTVNTVFPLLDADECRLLLGSGYGKASSSGAIVEKLVSVAGGTIEQLQQRRHTLHSTFLKLTTIIQDESVNAIRSLILMSLLFRSNDDVEMAWRVLGIAVTKAQGLALNRRIPRRSDDSTYRQQVNTWWALFILDKTLAVELQRPPMINDSFYDQEPPVHEAGTFEERSKKACLEALMDLAKVQGRICERLLDCSQSEESGKLSLKEAIRTKMQVGGETDELLLNWNKSLPEVLRPSEFPSCDSAILPAAAFLALQYYQTLFLIHRNSLIINPETLKAEIEAHFAESNFRSRMQNSTSICVNAARSIVNVLSHLLERHPNSILLSLYAPLISVYALAIHTIKNPGSATARTDLEILASASRIIESFEANEADGAFRITTMVNSLHAHISARVSAAIKTSNKTSPATGLLGVSDSSGMRNSQTEHQNQSEFSVAHDILAEPHSLWVGPSTDMIFPDSDAFMGDLDWNTIEFTLGLQSL